MNQIYLTLAKMLAPCLPFLVEESYSHYKLGMNSTYSTYTFSCLPALTMCDYILYLVAFRE